MDERARIDAMLARARVPIPEGGVGPGDDAAVLPWRGGRDLVVTTDLVAEGVHFRSAADPERVGRFAAVVNLSDLAAMGAKPEGFLAAIGAPPDTPPRWHEDVAEGMMRMLESFGVPMWGGDTKEAATRVITGTALGSVPRGTALLVGAVRPGDHLVLTGAIGAAGAAVEAWRSGSLGQDVFDEVVLGVRPHVDEGMALRRSGAHAMIDLSDGLAAAAARLAEASDCALVLDVDALPVADRVGDILGMDVAASDAAFQRAVLAIGGDYVLLAAVPSVAMEAARRATAEAGGEFHVIGTAGPTAGPGAQPRGARLSDGTVLDGLGYRHFTSG